jgi:alkylation response protein AidB-like acyl-CoA dehydrogenase
VTREPPETGIDADPVLTAEVEGWLAAHWDPGLPVEEWWRVVADAGWVAPHFPTEWGGRGLSRRAQSVVRQTFRRCGALVPPGGLGLLMAAPVILTHGTPDQVERHVRPILDGRWAWCQLFSEPGAGSDLAGLTTRAERDGERWRVTGQKVWSSYAHDADWGMLVARTDFDVAKHAGLSWFAFSLDQPGVEVRPLREATGHALFNEVFFDGAIAEADDLVGGEGNGWAVVNTTLMFERAGIGAGGAMAGWPPGGPKGGFLGRRAGDAAADEPPEATAKVLSVDELIGLAREHGRAEDPHVRRHLARLVEVTRTGEWTAKRARVDAAVPGFANLGKLAQTRIMKGTADVALEILGPDGLLGHPDGPDEGRYAEALVFATASSIYGGTDEIQRNVIGERALGLPREPSADRGIPFRDVLRQSGREREEGDR